jgi:hypothetical protein
MDRICRIESPITKYMNPNHPVYPVRSSSVSAVITFDYILGVGDGVGVGGGVGISSALNLGSISSRIASA